MPYRIVLCSPDRGAVYDGRTPEVVGVGGGITARISLLAALAALGHDVTAYVNCRERIHHQGVKYVPLDHAAAGDIDTDVFIAMSTGGALTFAPLRAMRISARVRIVWVQGVPAPADLEAAGADRYVTASRFLRDVLVERWGVPRDSVWSCYNGLHQSRFAAAEADWRTGRWGPPAARDPFAIAFIGPPEKGLDAAIEVLGRLRAHDMRYHLDVIGGGGLWGAADEGRSPAAGVRMVGLLGQAALVPRLFDYEFCLAPQAMEEGFGIAVQEARRAGQIAVASRVGAFGELIQDGVDGFLVDEPHTSAAAQDRMARTILEIAEDPRRRERVRRRGVASASAFSWDLAARAWTDYCEPFVGEPGSKARAIDADARVLVGGYYGHGNLGDEAILRALLLGLRRNRPGVAVTVASGNPAATRAMHKVDAVDERDPVALASAAARASAVIVGGGGLFHDQFGLDEATMLSAEQWGLAQLAAFAVIAEDAGRPFVIQDAGVGPLARDAAKRLTRLIFERASLAGVRDDASSDMLRSIGLATGSVRVTADPAFLLDTAPAEDTASLLADAGVPSGSTRFIAAVVRSWGTAASADDWRVRLAETLDRLAADHRVPVVFLPFQSTFEGTHTNDRRTAEAVRERMRRRDAAFVSPEDFNPSEMQRICAAADLVVTMRLHGAILAANAGTPVVAIAYDPKVRALMRTLRIDDQAIDLASLRADEMVELADRAMSRGRRAFPDTQRASALASVAQLAALLRHPPAERPAPSAEWRDLAARAHRRAAAAMPQPPPPDPAPAALTGQQQARRLYRRFVLPTLKQAAALGRRHLMSAPAYAFDRYKRARMDVYGANLSGLAAPGEPGVVTVVLPVYNGASMVRESIDSVLSQTHARLELIVIDDGSTDGTSAIVDAYAAADARVRVVHQENRTLPAALSRGFRLARGEFLTWTSADNRMKPRGLEDLVACLCRHPAWDMAYGNIDIIGEDGRALRHSAHFEGYQQPPGSEHVHLPRTTAGLNVIANNAIGAAFLYRARVPYLIGDYSRRRFVMEDYDYWMRVNALLTLRHANIDRPLYDYRFHRRSLTSRWAEFDMLGRRERMMVFDDFRRDFFLRPMVWAIEGSNGAVDLQDALAARVDAARHVRLTPAMASWGDLPRSGVPLVYARASVSPIVESPPPDDLPANALTVLLTESHALPARVDARWDLCIAIGNPPKAPRLARDFQGWLVAVDLPSAFQAVDARAKSAELDRLEVLAESGAARSVSDPRVSIVICARRVTGRLERTLAAIDGQRSQVAREIILVDNSGRRELAEVPGLKTRGSNLRIVVCPLPGLSAARNAGLAEARGQIVCFLDDDAVPEPEWFGWIIRAFDEHPETKVVGGRVTLTAPTAPSPVLQRGWRKYWSEFQPQFAQYAEVSGWSRFPWGANWSARRDALHAIGGFRSRYGRTGDDYWGGEEMVAAALIQRLGGRVAIEPRAVVVHDVDPSRFTFRHVFRTIVAGHQVYQRAQADLYAPRPNRVRGLAARVGQARPDRGGAGAFGWLDAVFRLWALGTVVVNEVKSLSERARRPVVEE